MPRKSPKRQSSLQGLVLMLLNFFYKLFQPRRLLNFLRDYFRLYGISMFLPLRKNLIQFFVLLRELFYDGYNFVRFIYV